MRSLHDARQADLKKNLIPAAATDGSVNWIRLDNVPVSGRLVVMSRSRRIASSYDCCACPCTDDYCCVSIDPYEIAYLLLGSQLSYWSTAEYDDCNGGQSSVAPSFAFGNYAASVRHEMILHKVLFIRCFLFAVKGQAGFTLQDRTIPIRSGFFTICISEDTPPISLMKPALFH
jgi:hypothetical protein